MMPRSHGCLLLGLLFALLGLRSTGVLAGTLPGPDYALEIDSANLSDELSQSNLPNPITLTVSGVDSNFYFGGTNNYYSSVIAKVTASPHPTISEQIEELGAIGSAEVSVDYYFEVVGRSGVVPVTIGAAATANIPDPDPYVDLGLVYPPLFCGVFVSCCTGS